LYPLTRLNKLKSFKKGRCRFEDDAMLLF